MVKKRKVQQQASYSGAIKERHTISATGALGRPCFRLAGVNLILLFPEDFSADAPGHVLLRGRRLLHVAQIQRASVGQELRVGVLDGRIGKMC